MRGKISRRLGFVAGFAAVMLGTAPPSWAQSQRINVIIDVTTPDALGRQLAFYLRDEVGKSGQFHEVSDTALQAFKVSLVTLDPDRDDSGSQTVYSYVVLLNNPDGLDDFLTSYVGVCGKQRIRSCASDMFGYLGEQVEVVRQALNH